jgi:hypothetical protein
MKLNFLVKLMSLKTVKIAAKCLFKDSQKHSNFF